MLVRIVIGLGNPDTKYQNTAHNAGQLFIHHLKAKENALPFTLYASPTYMNASGSFVKEILRKTGFPPSVIVIAHDDSDIELGAFKLSFGRGAAGHHGIEDIIRVLGTKNFWRLRIGIRPKERAGTRKKAGAFVLRPLTLSAKKLLANVFEEALVKIQTIQAQNSTKT